MQSLKYYIPAFFPNSKKCQAKKELKIFVYKNSITAAPRVNIWLINLSVGLKNLKYNKCNRLVEARASDKIWQN